jgi:hypothetical protein
MGAYGGPLACTDIEKPEIKVQPLNQSSCLGQSASFWVGAAGSPPLAYQWWFAGTPLLGRTNASLVLTNLEAGNAGVYWVVVSNRKGIATSDQANLAVFDACVDIHMYAGLTIAGQQGSNYVLKYTPDCGNTNFATWTPLATNTMTGSNWFYLDMESPFSPNRCYGVKLLP